MKTTPKKNQPNTYHIFLAAEGSGENYLGECTSMRAAKAMAAQHARGEIYALEESLYETARVSGHCGGLYAPPTVGEPVEWFGRGGWYCACREAVESAD